MSSARSSHDLLAARDGRQEALARHLAGGAFATVTLALNVPGANKLRPGADGLFEWARATLCAAFPGWQDLSVRRDALGPFALVHVPVAAAEAKTRCLRIEARRPFARLVDLDVYDGQGRQIDRARLGLPARRCLACGESAAECIRLGRHRRDEIEGITDELLAPFQT